MGSVCCCLSVNQADEEAGGLLKGPPPITASPSSPPSVVPTSSSLPHHADGDQRLQPSTSTYQSSLRRNPGSADARKLPKGSPDKQPYYCGKISTRKAEDLLKHTQLLDGTFLVRESQLLGSDRTSNFILSVIRDGVVYHLDIHRGQDGKYSLNNIPSAKSFRSVAKLVSYYQKKTIDLAGGGTVLLKYYLPSE